MSITSTLELLRSQLPSHVKLVAVSKTHPQEAIAEAYAANQRVFGESRPQELVAKYNALPKDIEWRMIGHLQTNKVKMIAPFVSLIESLDSERLAREINLQAERCERTIDCLLQVHVAQETTKSGWQWSELQEFVNGGRIDELHNIRVRGLMCIASNTDDEQRVKSDFETLQRYFIELKAHFGDSFDTLSMGMSDDYELAIECGATSVRIGSMIFGSR